MRYGIPESVRPAKTAPSCAETGTSTATGSAATRSAAHCVAPAGVLSVEQCSTSIGWPFTPPRYSFAYSTVALKLATSSSSEPNDAFAPSVTKPTVIGVSVASFGSPSTSSAAGPVVSVDPASPPSSASSLLLQAPASNARAATAMSTAFRPFT